MNKIKLTRSEYEYILNSPCFSDKWKEIISISNRRVGDLYIITITRDQSDELRDLFGDRLQFVGFNEQYNPTYEGKILESLIDKFFC